MQRLSVEALKNYVAPEGVSIELPSYEVEKVTSGIVHIGPGNFPLAHIAEKTHDLMQSGDKDALKFGIVGVNLNSYTRSSQLDPQDGLYTVVEQEPTGAHRTKVIGSVLGVNYAPEGPAAVINSIAAPSTRIVSLTVTPQTHQSYMTPDGDLNLTHPDIAHDLDKNNQPKTLFGYIVRGLDKRQERSLPGVTIMNLDNMEHNGDVLGKMVLQFADEYGLFLGDADVTFPNSMVDRIVPRTTPEFVEAAAERTGFRDEAAIPAEPMPKIGSWVIEDKFANGRPAWEKINGVQIVPDVLPYEKMKLRLLNASHAAIANLGDLAGYTYIDETMAKPHFQNLMASLMENETCPTLAPVSGVDLAAYKAELVERFVNPTVKDTTARVAKDAPLKVVLDCAQDQLDQGGSIELLALSTAAWMRRFRLAANEAGSPVIAVHPLEEVLKAKAAEGGNDPRPMFSVAQVFGPIGQNPDFVEAVSTYMDLLDVNTVEAAIKTAIAVSDSSVNEADAPRIRMFATSPTPGPA